MIHKMVRNFGGEKRDEGSVRRAEELETKDGVVRCMGRCMYRDTEVSRRNESWQDEVGRDALSQGKPIFGKTYGSSVVR